MIGITRKHSEMNRAEWIYYRWEEITTCSDTEPVYLRGIKRNIDEAQRAASNFDLVRKCGIALRKMGDK